MFQPLHQRVLFSLSLSTALLCASPVFCQADPLDQVGFHLARDSAADSPATTSSSNPISTNGTQQIIRSADSFLVATLITLGLKSVVHEQRPDHSGDDSFPSAHTSAAFAIATTQAHFHPKQAPYWYGAATLVGVQRVHADKHHWHDVAAGAVIGYFTAKLEGHQKNGLILRPFIKNEDDRNSTRTAGLSVGATF